MESWANGQPGNAKMACLPKSITSIGKPRDQCDKEKAVSVETILEILRENPKGLSHAKLAHAVADSGVSTHGMSRGLTLRLQLAQAFAASRGSSAADRPGFRRGSYRANNPGAAYAPHRQA